MQQEISQRALSAKDTKGVHDDPNGVRSEISSLNKEKGG
jgi:hypothetical protein